MFLVQQWQNALIKENKNKIKLLIIEESKELNQAIKMLDLSLFQVCTLVDFDNETIKEECANYWYQQRKNKDCVSLDDAYSSLKNNLINFATCLISLNYVDLFVVGVVYDSKSCFSSLLKILKNPDQSPAYSTMVMCKGKEIIFMSDCALNLSISQQEIKPLINYSYKLAKDCFFIEDNYAGLIGYHTANSFNDPDLNLLGPLQFDAIVNLQVRTKKLPNSHNYTINHYIFQELTTANVVFKIYAQKMDYMTIGTYIHNLKRSVSVLSRSATSNEILATIYLLAYDFI